MNEWVKQEDGRVDELQRGGFVVRGTPLGHDHVLGVVSFGPRRKSLPTNLPLNSRTKITSDSMEESSAGFTKPLDSLTLQELKDFIATIITQLENLVDSFVCNVIATSKKGSLQNG